MCFGRQIQKKPPCIRGKLCRSKLLSETECLDKLSVTVDVVLLEVLKQVLSASYHLEKTAVGTVVLLVRLHVNRQTVDLLG